MVADVGSVSIFLWLGGVLIGTVVTLVAGYFAYIAYIHHIYRHIPGPPRTSFILGNVSQMREARREKEGYDLDLHNNNKSLADKPLRFELMEKWADEYGDTFVVYILHRALVFTRSVEALKQILVHGDQQDFPKSNILQARYLWGSRYLGDGLATAVNHDEWYVRRKILDAVFHRRQLQQAIDVFNVSGDLLLKELQPFADSGESICLMNQFHRTTLDVIMRSMFSMDTEHLNSEFHAASERFVRKSFEAMEKFSGSLLPKYNPMLFNYRRQIQKLLEEYRGIGGEIINERKKMMERGEPVPEDLLTVMIRAEQDGSGYTYDIMLDEFNTIVLAGMETSANTLSNLFMELGRRPDLWNRLVAEVDEVVGHRAHITNDDITRLGFTQQLIKETLRLYPPATAVLRDIKKECTLGGYMMPAGTLCMIMIAGSNRNPALVKDPLKFDPDRFDPKAEVKVPVWGFLSFSMGLRNCIGQVFAQMEMRVMIAKFVQHYRFKLDPSENFKLGQLATIFPLNQVKCQLYSR